MKPAVLAISGNSPATGPGLAVGRQAMALATPVLVEHLLHIVVGLTDTYLANHLPENASPATAAVGTIAYFLWFVGIAAAAVGTGSTAIIARAMGARHRRLANKVCGQSIVIAAAGGIGLAALVYVAAEPLCRACGLTGVALDYGVAYLTLIAVSLPLTVTMFVGASCLRGAGDTLSPAAVLVVVDVVNVVFTFALCRGWYGLPEMGLRGIALGTTIAYAAGGLLVVLVLLRGRGGIRLYPHRLVPHPPTIRRVLRIGVPSGIEQVLAWSANMVIVAIINRLGDRTAAAHINAIRIESISYMTGFAAATAVATMVGQSLGMGSAARARRSAWTGYALGGGIMTAWGLAFILLGPLMAGAMSNDPDVAIQTATCLWIAGFVQIGFAAAAVFGGALRGAGDTVAVMVLNLISILGVRLLGVLIVTQWLGYGLTGIWVVLCVELMVRGGLMLWRFLGGRWERARV